MQTIKRTTYLIGFLAALVVVFAARTLYYYRGWYTPPDTPESTPQHVESLADELETGARLDGRGLTVLIDLAHGNGFDPDELGLFTGRLAASGAGVEFVEDGGRLLDQLRNADTLLVIAPNRLYEASEAIAVQDFVSKGGHVIIVGDPTRQEDAEGLNSLAAGFGVIYQDDYVYSLTRNDGNFRNVLFTEFADDSLLTEGLNEIVFQTALSLRTAEGVELIQGDDEVFSSRNEKAGGVVVAALTGNGRVLSLPDLTFMTSPFNTFADNDVLLNNVVAFALGGDRAFGLTDFPYFFDGPVQIAYQEAVTLNNTFAGMVELRTSLTESGSPASLVEELDDDAAYVYLALYDEASEDILDRLEDDGVTISDEPLSEDSFDSEGTIEVEGVARLEKGGAVLLHLVRPPAPEGDGGSGDTGNQEDEEAAPEPYRLVLLAATEDDLLETIDLLLSGGLDECLITAWTAVCQLEEGGGEEPTPTPGDGGISGGNILIVSDDTTLVVDGSNSAASMWDVVTFLIGGKAVLHSLANDGPLTIGDLAEYDMVFWSIGDYCCTTPTEENALLLQEYLDGGGKLLIDGVFIATDWRDTEFLTDYLGAIFLGFGVQVDLMAGDEPHPVSEGFGGATIPFNLTSSNAPQPDIIAPSGDGSVVFVRGPESASPGEASVIAYEENSRQVVYAAFSLYVLPDDYLQLFLENVINWFS